MTAPGRGYIGRAVASPNGIAAGSLSWFSSARWTLKGKEWCLFSVFIEGVTGPLTGHFFEGEKGGGTLVGTVGHLFIECRYSKYLRGGR